MIIASDLLDILCCPSTHNPLTILDKEGIDSINKNISEKKLYNRAGKLVEEHLQGGLLEKVHNIVYPIKDGIPILLEDEGIQFNNNLHNTTTLSV